MQRQGALLLDVREVAEYAEAHAPGSILIPLGQLSARLHELQVDARRPIALICRSGNRSGKALALLQQAGFSALVNVEGGMLAWKKAGLPVLKASSFTNKTVFSVVTWRRCAGLLHLNLKPRNIWDRLELGHPMCIRTGSSRSIRKRQH
jgi:rhodanese-related sulfurtransferase